MDLETTVNSLLVNSTNYSWKNNLGKINIDQEVAEDCDSMRQARPAQASSPSGKSMGSFGITH